MSDIEAPLSAEVKAALLALYDGFNDDERFAEESLVVSNEAGQLVPLKWRTAQFKLDEAIKKQQRAGKPVRIIILKSRRAGFSTGVAAKMFKQTAFYPGQATLIVSHQGEAAANLFGMYACFLDHYNPFGGAIELDKGPDGKPTLSRNETKDAGYLEFVNRSSIRIATAKNLQGTRSFGFRKVHLSEFAFYPDAKTLMTALMQTVPDDPDTMVIIESTANGVGDEFYDTWMRATDPDRQSDWLPLFFAWHEDPQLTRVIQGDKALFQNSLTTDERDEQRQYDLTLEQLNWRRWAIENKCGGDPRMFHQEYPGNPMEAFLTSGNPVFEPRLINRHTAMDGAIGELEHTEYNGKREMFFRARERGALRLFKRPERGRQYVIGVDTASGLDATDGKGTSDSDYSSAQVFDMNTGEQVASFRTRLWESQYSEAIWSLGAWYNWAYIVPEVQGGYGRAMLDRLVMAVTEPVIRPAYPLERIYNRRDETIPSKPRYEDLGFQTNGTTKPQLIAALSAAFYEGSILVYDPVTLQELRTFVKKGIKMEASTGRHDDTVISLALAVIGIARAPRLQLVPNKNAINSAGDAPLFYGQSIRRRLNRN